MVVVNAAIIYGLLFRQTWSWFVLMAYTLISLLNPGITLPFLKQIAPGSLVFAIKSFQDGNSANGWILVYASIFSLTLLLYSFYGWRTLSKSSITTDNTWALIMGFIFLWNVSGVMKLFFGQDPSFDMLLYSVLFVGLIVVWHWLENKQAPVTKSGEKGVSENKIEERKKETKKKLVKRK